MLCLGQRKSLNLRARDGVFRLSNLLNVVLR